MHVRLISDIGHVMPKIDLEGICTSSRRKLKRAYDDLRKGKICDHGTSFELKMLCLFYFVLEGEKNRHNIETAVVHGKQFYFPLLYSLFFI